MIPLSCVNCCYNALQYDTLGMTFGYCTEHRRVLQSASELTCGRHLRKDLPIESARRERDLHQQRFSPAFVSVLRSRKRANGSYSSARAEDLAVLRRDTVADVVTDYGRLDAKIESLAQLRAMGGARSEIAMLSLSRSYVSRCVERQGQWTSGLHLLWWTRKRLAEEPVVEVEDFRVETPLPLTRQLDLAKWSILMLRLIFISDVGSYARANGSVVKRLSSLAEDAASATGSLSSHKLLRWVRRQATTRFDSALPEHKYVELSRRLHRDQDIAPS